MAARQPGLHTLQSPCVQCPNSEVAEVGTVHACMVPWHMLATGGSGNRAVLSCLVIFFLCSVVHVIGQIMDDCCV